ncbi:PLP-dependent aminotransferase family protein [Streptomyces sp. YC504]|uniref:PLP-dependent aminotransferase family protein n=1 Tax=Streptomyces mesophilus TaxID=1775132 RepID=A0A6G4XA16_9ACTN|nr:PLP-dependent aminotransferase family protein [Streptomyces mesophilus]NGO74365.1 PLP-dependent aminotransferase family protein [Streptomyces mesophilus]
MPVEWTGSRPPELVLSLDRGIGHEPLGTQLQCELRDAIRGGRLAAGERLPSSRELARTLGVSRGLVIECYAQLEAEGYLSAHPGSATRVAARATTRTESATPARPQALAVDFRSGVPELSSFPLHDWLRSLTEAGRRAPVAASGYGDARGSAVLREVLAAYLRRVRGAAADPEHTMICSGFAQAANLLFAALAREGITEVALEDPGDRDCDAIALRNGLRPVPVPVDGQGIDVAALRASGARAVVLTPAHQSPTGVVLAPNRRQALARWAEAADALIIEDDYDAEFRYDRRPVGSLQGLVPDRVASVGSVSKSLAPALRLGWILCPPHLTAALAHDKYLADRGSPALEQLALARLIESGRYDRHLRRMRTVYATRHQVLAEALARHAPEVELTGLAAGFHAVAQLPPGVDEQHVVTEARARSVGLYGMSDYRADGATQPAQLVLGFGNVTDAAIRRAIGTIADLLQPTAAEPPHST